MLEERDSSRVSVLHNVGEKRFVQRPSVLQCSREDTHLETQGFHNVVPVNAVNNKTASADNHFTRYIVYTIVDIRSHPEYLV